MLKLEIRSQNAKSAAHMPKHDSDSPCSVDLLIVPGLGDLCHRKPACLHDVESPYLSSHTQLTLKFNVPDDGLTQVCGD